MIIAGTGHRPPALGGYSDAVLDNLVRLGISALDRYKPATVISGMALGWDQALAIAAINLQIPVIAAIPFEGQELRWPDESKARYNTILANAERVVVSEGEYSPHLMQVRNEWMVGKCDMLLALWNGGPGGTRNCVNYAISIGKPIVNLWPSWVKYRR